MNLDIFKNKKTLITGHTGFKGSWLSAWLSNFGSNVIGVSNDVPTEPSHYHIIKNSFFQDLRIDMRDSQKIYDLIKLTKPDFIFHLAAQPIVLQSYEEPLATLNTNIIGTANLLDALRKVNHECISVIITSDKCYDNIEKNFGYSENDRLGGKDPYSGSKGAAELIIRSYFESYFKKSNSNIKIAVGRAGNVIGGGDWAQYRIVPDCIRKWSKNKKPEIRNPLSTRPWQHVLEPLGGYLYLASSLYNSSDINGEAFNFGPLPEQNYTVKSLVEEITSHWPGAGWLDKSSTENIFHEAGLLQLDCSKALKLLSWESRLSFKETAKWTSDWYQQYYEKGLDSAFKMTIKQIIDYMNINDLNFKKRQKDFSC